MAILPIGYGGLCNHHSDPNLQVGWYYWNRNENQKLGQTLLDETLSSNASAILQADFSLLDLKYTATRDIEMGDELFIDYGIKWINAWALYLADSLVYKSRSEEERGHGKDMDAYKPIFRQFIQPPQDLLPASWDSKGSDGKFIKGEKHGDDEDNNKKMTSKGEL